MPPLTVVCDRGDGVDDLTVILQQVVNQDAAASFVLHQKLTYLVQALFGEMQVQCRALVGFLDVADLVGFIGGEKVVLIGLPERKERCAETQNTRRNNCSSHFQLSLLLAA